MPEKKPSDTFNSMSHPCLEVDSNSSYPGADNNSICLQIMTSPSSMSGHCSVGSGGSEAVSPLTNASISPMPDSAVQGRSSQQSNFLPSVSPVSSHGSPVACITQSNIPIVNVSRQLINSLKTLYTH